MHIKYALKTSAYFFGVSLSSFSGKRIGLWFAKYGIGEFTGA